MKVLTFNHRFDKTLQPVIDWLYQWFIVINGNLSFGDPDAGIKQDNILSYYVDVADTGLANTEFSVSHGLNLIPAGYILVSSSISCNIYQQKATGTAWTKSTIFLKCDQAHAAIRLLILGH